MPDLIRHPVKLILDSGFRRNDNVDIYCCRSNHFIQREFTFAKALGLPASRLCPSAGHDEDCQEAAQAFSAFSASRPFSMIRFVS